MKTQKEILKLIADVGKIEYKFIGLKGEEWANHKPSTRYGQLPYLKVSDDFTVYQTIAIARYLAQEGNAGLYPSDRKEATLTEEIVTAVDELITGFVKVFFITKEENRPEELKAFSEGTLKRILTAFEKLLSSEGTFFAGKLTWADLYLFDCLMSMASLGVDYSFATKILKFKEIVGADQRVKSFLESENSLRKK